MAALPFSGRDDARTTTSAVLSSKFKSTQVFQAAADGLSDQVFQVAPESAAASVPAPVDNRTLYEQLAANKETKNAEWKEKHNPFKPPPGLDEDEAEFFQQVEESKRVAQQSRTEQMQQDRRAFHDARAVGPGTTGAAAAAAAASAAASVASARGKTKFAVGGLAPKKRASGAAVGVAQKRPRADEAGGSGGDTAAAAAPPAAGGAAIGLLLGGYASSSSSSDDDT